MIPGEHAAEAAFQEWLSATFINESANPDDYVADLDPLSLALFRVKVQEYQEIQASIRGRVQGLLPGAVLGDYRLIQEVGRGGTGMVWEAEQVSIKRRVALKLLHPYFQLSQEIPEAFLREAQASGRLAHDGIVRIYNIETVGTHRFLVMELVPGGRTLVDIIRETHRLGTMSGEFYEWAAHLFIEVAEALQVAHNAGVVHLDLKPANVLLDAGGHPKIADFGISRLLDGTQSSPSNSSHTPEGTWHYMSPEQVAGFSESAKPVSDVFSLGATFYEVLTGARPFDGATPEAIRNRIRLYEPVELREVLPSVPESLDLICRKMLRKLQSSRYPDMGAIIADLKAFLRGEPVLVARVSLKDRARLWVKQHPVQFALIGMSLLLVLLMSFAAFKHWLVRNQLEHAVYTTSPLMALSHAESQYRNRDELLLSLQAHENSLSQISFRDDVEKAKMLVRLGRSYLEPFESWADAQRVLTLALALGALPQPEADVARVLLAKACSRLALHKSALVVNVLAEWQSASQDQREALLLQARRSHSDYAIARDLLHDVSKQPIDGEDPDSVFRAAWAANRLAVIDLDCRHLDKARVALLEVAALLDRHQQNETGLYFLNQLDLAICFRQMENFQPAKEAGKKALSGYLRLFGPSHHEVPYCWFEEANLCYAMGDLEGARSALQNAQHTALLSTGAGSSIHQAILNWGAQHQAWLSQE